MKSVPSPTNVRKKKLNNPHWPTFLGSKPEDYDLSRIKELLTRLGNPEKSLPPVIHVAGTNGKGSTIAFLKSILEEAGYKVHSYTSPHLIEFNERITLANEKITDDFLHEILEECRQASEDITVTFFEGTTASAFLAFSKIEADIVLLETGLGGRLDATNVIDNPALTIITHIDYDHMEFLGDSLKEIAGEKAAIIKKSAPCITCKQNPEVMEVINIQAEEQDSELIIAPANTDYKLSLSGDFQQQNAAMAIEAVKKLDFLEISEENIKSGLQNAKWSARLQEITIYGKPAILDGGHNISAARQLNQYLRTFADTKFHIVIGMLKNRDCREFLSTITSGLSVVSVSGIKIPDEENCYSSEEITNICNELNLPTQTNIDLAEAISAIDIKPDEKIIICGSLYLAGYVLAESDENV